MKSTPVQKNLQLAENFALLEELSDEASSQVSGGRRTTFGGERYRQNYSHRHFAGGHGRGANPNDANFY